MTTRYKTRAFVFKKSDKNESDRVFSVFTDNFGQLDIFAKAIRKITSKLRSGIDVFFLSEIEFIQGKSQKTLTDAIKIEKFNNVSDNPEKMEIAGKIGEILDNFIRQEEKDQDIFNLLNETFYKLDDCNLNSSKSLLVYYYFLWNALSLLGYKSEVSICAGCGVKLIPDSVYFSGKEGGIICSKCLVKDKLARKVNSDTVKILRIILLKDWQTLLKLKVEPSMLKILSEVSENAVQTFSPAYC